MANTQLAPIVSTLINLVTGPSGVNAVQGFLQLASATANAEINAIINNALNAINQFEGDLNDANTATQQIINTLLLDTTQQTPLIVSVAPGVDTFATEMQYPFSPSETPLVADGVTDLSSVGIEPLRTYSGEYPYNHVYISEAGHIIETDDTPGNARLLRQHFTGTYDEMLPDGSRIIKVIGKNYHIVASDDNIYVQGSVNLTAVGAINITCLNDVNIQSAGKINMIAQEEIRMKGKEIYFESSNGDIQMLSSANVNIQSANNTEIDSGGKFNVLSVNDMNIKSNANANITSKTDSNINGGSNVNIQSTSSMNLNIGDTGYIETTNKLNVATGDDCIIDSQGAATIQSVDITAIDCASFDVNFGEAEIADDAGNALKALDANPAKPTNIYLNISRDLTSPTNGIAAGYLPDRASVENDDVPGGTNIDVNNYHDNRQLTDDEHDKIVNASVPSPTLSANLPGSLPNISVISSTNNVENNNLIPTLKISKYFTIGHLTTLPTFHYPLVAQHGLSEQQIVKNMSLLALNCLDKIKENFADLHITSGFRSKLNPLTASGSISQHELGQAADLQFSSTFHNDPQLLTVAHWVALNVPFDQLILERSTLTSNYWLHVSFVPNGRRQILSCGNPGSTSEKYISGLHIFD